MGSTRLDFSGFALIFRLVDFIDIFKKRTDLILIMAENPTFLKRMTEVIYGMAIVIIISALIGLILAFPVMLLWNYVFGRVYDINVFQAWALNVLIGILFGKNSGGGK